MAHKEVVDAHHQYPAPKAGTEGESHQHPVPKARGHRLQIPPPPVESGCPEMGAEFAACVKDKFILRGPRERMEGGMGTGTQPTSMPTSEMNTVSDEPAPTERETRHIAPVTYPHNEHLLQEAKGHYKEDSFFQKILEMPRVFKSFSLTDDGFICLKMHDRIVICIPDIWSLP